jgi:hypothetical protein
VEQRESRTADKQRPHQTWRGVGDPLQQIPLVKARQQPYTVIGNNTFHFLRERAWRAPERPGDPKLVPVQRTIFLLQEIHLTVKVRISIK